MLMCLNGLQACVWVSVSLCVKMDCCTCMNLCFSASILHPHSKCFFKHPPILPNCLSVFLRGVCYYISQWGAKKLLLKQGLFTCHSSLLTAGRVFLVQNMHVCAIRLSLSIFSFHQSAFILGPAEKVSKMMQRIAFKDKPYTTLFPLISSPATHKNRLYRGEFCGGMCAVYGV